MAKKLITFIFPIYNESSNIELLHKTLAKLILKHAQYDYELIFINDGSRDDSLDKLIGLQQQDKQVVIINLSRNFGHQMAVTAGLDYAHGDAVIIMDSDLQDPPRVGFELIKKWRQGYEVVYAQRRSRKDGLLKKLTADWYYRLLHNLADIDIPRNTGDFRLLDRKVVNELNKFRERNRYLRGMVSSLGFRQTAVLFDRDERHGGHTGYSIQKMLKFAIDGLLGFSTAPLRLISQLGLIISGLSFFGIVYALIERLARPTATVHGWTFTIIVILFIGGIQLSMLGILGTYIGRIYTEIQARPLYIVESILSRRKHKQAPKKP